MPEPRREMLEAELVGPLKEMRDLAHQLLLKAEETGCTVVVLMAEPIDPVKNWGSGIADKVCDLRHVGTINFLYREWVKSVAKDLKGGADAH